MNQSRQQVIDVSDLSPYTHDTDAPLWWGMIGLIVIETVVVASMISSYLFIRAQHAEWPLGAIEPPDLLMPSMGTAVLLLSSVAMWWGDKGLEENAKRRTAIGVALAAVLGAIFLILKAIEYSKVEYHWNDHVYGSLIWLMIGFHSAHVISVILKAVVIDLLAWRGYFNRERHIGVTINGMYWHFVVMIWIPLFITIYIVPRL